VEIEDRKRRTQMYINLSEKKLRAFYEKHLGIQQTVLFEEQIKKDKIVGFTENYIKVETRHDEDLVNQIKKVKLLSILPNGNVAIEFA
jgi:threonylcarbamoyladenosine tRNA methylthiotransferase MtaB